MKACKPTSPGRRFVVNNDNKDLTKNVKPKKSLCVSKKKICGRDNKGQISVRHRGGGSKRKYRIIDFCFEDMTLPCKMKIKTLEYDPNRSAYISKVDYENGDAGYVLAIEDIKVGDEIVVGKKVPIKKGNRMEVKNIPIGTTICNVELEPRKGAKVARSAGSYIQLTALDSGYAQVTMKSGEVRLIKDDCMATIGVVSNSTHHNKKIGKAGKKRLMGWRPVVRGAVMNPCDHPHGGGEGKAPVGNRKGPKTPWGKLARGVKTRKRKKYSDKLIIKRRKK